MAQFPIIDQFDSDKVLGEVVLNDDVARELAENAELVELIPMLAPNGTITVFSLMGSAFVEEDPDLA